MRIGILTLPIYNNYGGILQSYALQTVLEKMGHEVVVFYKPYKKLYPPLWIYPLCLFLRNWYAMCLRTTFIFYLFFVFSF